MRINSVNGSPNFKGGMNNKLLLSGLEKISEHGATFAAGVSFVVAVGLRPLAISLTPKTNKENKQYASANSIASGLMKLAIAEAVALPVENAIKNIDKDPEKFLNQKTIKTLQNGAKTLAESKDYKFITQVIKLGTGLLTAVPKSVLTVALVPLIMDKILNFKKEEKPPAAAENKYDPVFAPVSENLTFKGGPAQKITAKILENGRVQEFAKKFSKNDANIARNMAIATDVLLTASTSVSTKKSKKIKEERKNPLIYNGIISTAASILGGGALDKAIQKSTEGWVKKFAEANKNDPKLKKYIEGINILRPTIAFALVYYGILPVVSTFLADKADKIQQNKKM